MRPKPPGVSARLERTPGGLAVAPADLLSLQSRGYFFTRDGRLRSNDGELAVGAEPSIRYTLRFGEVLYGSGEAVSAGSDASDDADSGPGENRYLFITAEYEGNRAPEPPRPGDTDFDGKPEEDWTDADRANKDRHRMRMTPGPSGTGLVKRWRPGSRRPSARGTT